MFTASKLTSGSVLASSRAPASLDYVRILRGEIWGVCLLDIAENVGVYDQWLLLCILYYAWEEQEFEVVGEAAENNGEHFMMEVIV